MALQTPNQSPLKFTKDHQSTSQYGDFNGVIHTLRWVITDKDGRLERPVLALYASITRDDGEEIPDWLTTYLAWMDGWVPCQADGGQTALCHDPEFAGRKIGAHAEATLFLNELVSAGFPEDRLEPGHLGVVDGTHAHFVQKPITGKDGKEKTYTDKKGKTRTNTILVVSKVNRMPGEQVTRPTSTTRGTGPGLFPRAVTASPKQGNGMETDARTREVMMDLLIAHGGTMVKKDLARAAYKLLTEAKDLEARKVVPTRIVEDTFLATGGTEFTYDTESGQVQAI